MSCPSGKAKASDGSSNADEMSDLEFALQLSLAEEQSKKDADTNDFPPLSPTPRYNGTGKGKGKML